MSDAVNELSSVPCGPVSLTMATWETAMRWLAAVVESSGPTRYACFCEANLLSHAVGNPRLQGILKDAAAVFPDGVAAMQLAAAHGTRLPERLPGPTFLLKACEAGLEPGWKHFFYGGREGVAEQLSEKLSARFPGLKVCGIHSPPLRELDNLEECDAVLNTIEAAGPDILWVGLGGPKQEFWMDLHWDRLSVPVMFGVGAAFDFHSGSRRWAPVWIRRVGLEWLFRMATGGRTTFTRNVRCCARVTGLLLRERLACYRALIKTRQS